VNNPSQRRGQPNPGIGQPRPPRPKPKMDTRFRGPKDKYEDEERFMNGEDPLTNMTPAMDDDEEFPAVRRKLRERRRMNDGPEDRLPEATPPPRRTPPPSHSPMGRPTPRPAPGPMPTPATPSQDPSQRQSRLRRGLMRRRMG
jgi:hypothetical protein